MYIILPFVYFPGSFPEILCQPKVMPIKSKHLERLETLVKEAEGNIE